MVYLVCFQGKTIVQELRLCNQIYGAGPGICTRRTEGLEGSGVVCSGDSGSSVGTFRDGNFEIDGIVSFGDENCQLFDIHTDVINYVDWVLENIGTDEWE